MNATPTAELEVIPEWECLRLLQTRPIGRLAFVVGNQPLVLPVNYTVDDGTIVLRTSLGAKLANAPFTKVAFEVDEIDEISREGWSVLVQGVGQDISTSIDPCSERLRAIAPQPWAGGERAHYIRVVPREITGRRVHDGR
jgi:uncharacterized protein